jgi:hypothetical protein
MDIDYQKYAEFNTVSTFLLPLLRIEKEVFKGRIINSFLYDEDISNYQEEHVFILHSNVQDRNFVIFEKYLEDNENFVDSYDIVKGAFGIKVFKIPDDSLKNYQLFKKGEYSKFDMVGRTLCYRFGLLPENRILHHVFNKTNELKTLKEIDFGITIGPNQELWSIWDKKYDVITPDFKDFLKKITKKKHISPNEKFSNE